MTQRPSGEHSNRRRRKDGRRWHRRLRLECLELRRVLASFLVSTDVDVVDPNDGVTSLREAVASANASPGADLIQFQPALFSGRSTFELDLGELQITDSLTLAGPGQQLLTLRGGGDERVIRFLDDSGDLFLQGLTISDGKTTDADLDGDQSGGGIYFSSTGRLTLDRVTVVNNQTMGTDARGGGIFVDQGQLVLNKSLLTGNSTLGIDAQGGGLFANSGTVAIIDSRLSGNTTNQSGAKGGAIYSAGGPVSIIRSSVLNNRTNGDRADGGGVFSKQGVMIDQSVISGNATSGDDSDGGALFSNQRVSLLRSDLSGNRTEGRYAAGGGIAVESAEVTISNSSITANRTGGDFGYGSGMFAVRSNVSITNSTFSENVATGVGSDGGGISAFFSDVSIVFSTVSLNSTAGRGGGIAFSDNEDRTLQIFNSIVADNSDSGVAPDILPPVAESSLIAIANLIGDNTGTTLDEATTPDLDGNLIGSASGAGLLDPQLDPLMQAGITRVHPLRSASPAIDAALVSLANTIPFDQRGGPFSRISNFVPDRGSFEAQTVPDSRLVVTTTDDTFDLEDSLVSLREAVVVANGIPGDDIITFDPVQFAGENSIALSLGPLVISGSTTIAGPGSNRLVIDAQQNSRLITVSAGSIDVTLSGLTLSGGRTTANEEGGGAIQFRSTGTLAIVDSVLSNNDTLGDLSPGGAIEASAGFVTLSRSIVQNNRTLGTGSRGGGLSVAGLNVTDSTIASNSTFGAAAHGGGIASEGAILLSQATVTDNVASGDGGGLYSDSSSSSNLGNASQRFVSSTIASNRSGGKGGGASLGSTSSDSVVWQNSIVAGNSDAGLAPDLDLARVGGTILLQSNLIGDNTGTNLIESQTPDARGNMIGAALGAGTIDPLLGPLTLQGGLTPTRSLQLGSRAIDAGDISLVASIINDQRGQPFARVFDEGLDLGALETQTLPASALVVTTARDELDFANSMLSLREAIVLAAGSRGADTIRFDETLFGIATTINLELGQLWVSDSIDILGAGKDLLTIDAQGSSRVFDFTSEADIRLSGMTITGGRTLGDNANVQGLFESTYSGGAIRFDALGSLTLDGVRVTGNRTSGTAAKGAGLFVRQAALRIVQSEIDNNFTLGDAADGGGLFVDSNSASIESSLIRDNRTLGAGAEGGGIAIGGGTLAVSNSAVFQNKTQGAASAGGGISGIVDAVMSVTNSTISGNSTTGTNAPGGGLHSGSGTSVSITNTTIADNSATGRGGGINIATGTTESLVLHNSIVATNLDNGTSPDIAPPLNPANGVLRFSLIGDNTGTFLPESQTADSNGNLIGDPSGIGIIDPLLDVLGVHGGTTPTHALLAGSPAIGAGNNSLAVDADLVPLSGDQRGVPFARLFATVDLGSFELQPPQAPILSWTNPDNLFTGTALSNLQLSATARTPGTFAYTPDLGTVLPTGDDQTLTVVFTPDDLTHYVATSASVTLNVVPRSDLGDAPDSYGTLRDSDGARHLESTLRLGRTVDVEVDGQPSVDASGDDRDGNGDDEDGVRFISSVLVDSLGTTTASVLVTASRPSQLDAWIDFNGDGIFDPTAEHLGGGVSIDVVGGDNVISFTVPFTTLAGETFARFRLSSAGGLLPTGEAADGEVEDYPVTILSGFDTPTIDLRLPPGSSTLLADSGDLVVQQQGNVLFRAEAFRVGSYNIVGDEFSNVLVIDGRGGDAIPSGGLSFDGVDRVNTVRLVGISGVLDLTPDGNIDLKNVDVIDLSDPVSASLLVDAAAIRSMDANGGGVIVVGDATDSIRFADATDWRMAAPVAVAGFVFRVVSIIDTFVQLDFGSPWQNLAQPSDINNDGRATAGDALRIINELARRDFSDSVTSLLKDPADVDVWPNLFYDQNGDGQATALDALRVINELSRSSNGSGEGEALTDPSPLFLRDTRLSEENSARSRVRDLRETIAAGRADRKVPAPMWSDLVEDTRHDELAASPQQIQDRLQSKLVDEAMAEEAFQDFVAPGYFQPLL